MSTIAGKYPGTSLRWHVVRTLELALPVMVARAGLLVLVAVDTAMTGHAGAVELAYYALATAPMIPLMLVGIGLLMGTVVLTAQAVGAGRLKECGAVLRLSLIHAAAYGGLFIIFSAAGEWFLSATGQASDLAAGGGRVLLMFGWGMPGMFLYTAATFFLEGINRPLAGMLVMLLANILNLVLNWIFIFGNLGAPAMGAEGAALATTVARWFMFAAILAYVITRIDRERFGLAGPIAGARALAARLRRFGYPMALSHGLEASAFAAMTLFAGLLGASQVAGFQVAMNLVALAFMCALGFATAASVRVANAVGRRDARGARQAGWVAVSLAAVMLGAIGLVFYGVPESLCAVYTSDIGVLPIAVSAVAMAAFALTPDGVQGVLMGALRGIGDVWPVTLLYLISFWLVMAPLGYYLGVVRAGGAPALFAAIAVGCVVAVLLLGLRFSAVTRRALPAISHDAAW